MGNRSTDPYSSQLNKFQMTDKGWPQVMRVFPILDWSYAEVWQVMLALSIDYCSLYDQGYTSLGNPENTSRNPALEYKDHQGETSYKPAHTLQDGSEERAGRLKSKLSV
jgi:FAD synthetase